MRIIYNISGVLLATAILLGCARKNDILGPVVLPAGGHLDTIGATLNVTAQHHKQTINTGMVYIKYAATTMPAMDKFDDSFAVALSAAHFDSLSQGDYYIYAKGRDYTLPTNNDEVFGGAHFRVIDNLIKTYDLYLQMDNHKHHK